MSGSGARNGGGEPDWSKFGLDRERQPLRGGEGGAGRDAGGVAGAASGGGVGAPVGSDGGGKMFGGQIQHDSELFADDQVKMLQYKLIHYE